MRTSEAGGPETNQARYRCVHLQLPLALCGLFATGGLGLLLRQRWAEYLTTITASGLMPLRSMRWLAIYLREVGRSISERNHRCLPGGAGAFSLTDSFTGAKEWRDTRLPRETLAFDVPNRIASPADIAFPRLGALRQQI